MSSLILCPKCNRKLKISESVLGKTIRCPACKAAIRAMSKPDAPAPSRAVKQAPSPTASVSSRSRPTREDELEEIVELEDEEPIREKRPRKKRPSRKNSSTGLIIGLVAGGVLLLLLLGGGGWLLWHFLQNKVFLGADWQAFSPPGGDCTVLMPGTPAPQTLNGFAGVSGNLYSMERKGGREAFAITVFEIPANALRPSLLEDVANFYRKGVMDTLGGGQEMGNTSISLGKIPGLEFQAKLTAKGGSLSGRVYLAKLGNIHRAYLLAVVTKSNQPNTGDAARFLDSFKITAPATAPDLTGAAAGGGMQPPPGFNPPQPFPGRRTPIVPRP